MEETQGSDQGGGAGLTVLSILLLGAIFCAGLGAGYLAWGSRIGPLKEMVGEAEVRESGRWEFRGEHPPYLMRGRDGWYFVKRLTHKQAEEASKVMFDKLWEVPRAEEEPCLEKK